MRKLIAVWLVTVVTMAGLQAAEIRKAENQDALNLASSWVEGRVPTSTDTVVWHPLTATDTVALGGDLSVYGLDLSQLGGVASLNLNGTDGETLTIGAGGIESRDSGKTVKLTTKMSLAADQLWANRGGTFMLDRSGDLVLLNGFTLRVLTLNETKGNFVGVGGLQIEGSTKFSYGSRASDADVTVFGGGTFHWNQPASTARTVRAASVTLDGLVGGPVPTLYAQGSTSRNGYEAVTGALTALRGSPDVNVAVSASQSQKIEFGSLVLADAAAGLRFRGTNLGAVKQSELPNSSAAGIYFLTAPTLVGGIIPGALVTTNYGSTAMATGLATYDVEYGVRPLSDAEYETALTSGATQLNVRLESGSGAPVQVALAAGTTTVDSLTLDTFAHVTGQGGIAITGEVASVLKVLSGTVYARHVMDGSTGETDAFSIKGVTLDFDGNVGRIISRQRNKDNLKPTRSVNLDVAIQNVGEQGVTYAGEQNSGSIRLVGNMESSYVGPTRVVSGDLQLKKDAVGGDATVRCWAVPGDLYVYGGNCQNTGNQLKDTASVFVYGGNYKQKGGDLNSGTGAEEVFKDLTIEGGTATLGQNGTSGGATTMNDAFVKGGIFRSDSAHQLKMQRLVIDGGVATFGRWNSSTGNRARQFVQKGISITNVVRGTYSPILFDAGNYDASGQKFIPAGDMYLYEGVSFDGNATNTNMVWIDSQVPTEIPNVGRCPWPVVHLSAATTFSVGDGAADIDLAVRPIVADADIDINLQPIAAVGGIVKTGAGTLMLANANTYTGGTTVEAGGFAADGSIAGDVLIKAGASFAGGIMSETGSLTIGGALMFETGTHWKVSAAGSAVGQTAVAGAMTSAGTAISIPADFVLPEGGARLCTSAVSISGTFATDHPRIWAKIRNGNELWLDVNRAFILVVR